MLMEEHVWMDEHGMKNESSVLIFSQVRNLPKARTNSGLLRPILFGSFKALKHCVVGVELVGNLLFKLFQGKAFDPVMGDEITLMLLFRSFRRH